MIAPFHESLIDFKRDADVQISATGFVGTGGDAATAKFNLTRVTFKLSVGPAKRVGPLPLISCLMPTKNRVEQAKFAIACYRNQTWPNRELIVLDQNLDDRLASWIRTLNDPTVRVFSMPGLQEPLGTIRNRTVELASGALLCVWDDDDLQHPARLEIAAAAMAAGNAAACVLVRETIWMATKERVALRPLRPYCNTLMALRGVGLHYPPLMRGEDMPAVHGVLARHRSVWLDLPELYLYVAHGRNTVSENYLERFWEASTDRTEGSASLSSLQQLARIFPIAEYAAIMDAREPTRVAQ